jgi:omega-6 fatty acid desaturase (delta-12 desaturase)
MASRTHAELRRAVRPFRQGSDLRASLICLIDSALFIAALLTTVFAASLPLKLVASVLTGVVIARLFVIGHDAVHQAFFDSRQLNRWIGRLVLLPSLTPYSLWETGHNLSHHVYTNLKTHDFVWTPMSKAEFDALPRWRRALERLYRSGFGFWAYYAIEIWWRKMIFPNAREVPLRRPAFLQDSLFVTVFGTLWAAGLVVAAVATGQSITLLVLCGLVIPFLVWCLLMGSVIYFHHTSPEVAWYDDMSEWEAARDGVSGTVRMTFPRRAGRLVHNIMEHPAHHLDVRIPLYRIEDAQRELEEKQDSETRSRPFTLDYVRNCVTRCKLYDYAAHRWMDFDGHYTSGPTVDSQHPLAS